MQPGSLVTDIVYKLSYVKRVFWSPHTFFCHIVEVLTFKKDIIIIFSMHCSKAVWTIVFQNKDHHLGQVLKVKSTKWPSDPHKAAYSCSPQPLPIPDVSTDLHLLTEPKKKYELIHTQCDTFPTNLFLCVKNTLSTDFSLYLKKDA